jgi:hypothetical protein
VRALLFAIVALIALAPGCASAPREDVRRVVSSSELEPLKGSFGPGGADFSEMAKVAGVLVVPIVCGVAIATGFVVCACADVVSLPVLLPLGEPFALTRSIFFHETIFGSKVYVDGPLD